MWNRDIIQGPLVAISSICLSGLSVCSLCEGRVLWRTDKAHHTHILSVCLSGLSVCLSVCPSDTTIRSYQLLRAFNIQAPLIFLFFLLWNECASSNSSSVRAICSWNATLCPTNRRPCHTTWLSPLYNWNTMRSSSYDPVKTIPPWPWQVWWCFIPFRHMALINWSKAPCQRRSS